MGGVSSPQYAMSHIMLPAFWPLLFTVRTVSALAGNRLER